MKKINPERKCILILVAFNIIALAIFIPISAVFNLWGLTIGWAMGTVVTVISNVLLFFSGNRISQNAINDDKGTGLAILFYFVRYAMYIGIFVVCAFLHWKAKNEYFTWSIFTCAGSLLPSSLIIALFYRQKDEVNSKPTINKIPKSEEEKKE